MFTRDVGYSVITFLASCIMSQRLDSSSAPPGSLKANPMIAIGSMVNEAWEIDDISARADNDKTVVKY
jgi:hypothetical protein